MKTLEIKFKCRSYHGLIRFPKKFTRNHCDMQAMRISRRFSGVANSRLFEPKLNRVLRKEFGVPIGQSVLKVDLPEGAFRIKDGYLTEVTISIPDTD